jgi:hypothetical protein
VTTRHTSSIPNISVEPISYRGAQLSTLLHATVYMFLHNLLNVLVQIANKMRFKKICCKHAFLQAQQKFLNNRGPVMLRVWWTVRSTLWLTFPSLWYCVREICKLDINRRPARQITQCFLFILSSYWNGKSPVVYWTTHRFHCQDNETASLNLTKRSRSVAHVHSTDTQCCCRSVPTATNAPVLSGTDWYIYTASHTGLVVTARHCSLLSAQLDLPTPATSSH